MTDLIVSFKFVTERPILYKMKNSGLEVSRISYICITISSDDAFLYANKAF